MEDLISVIVPVYNSEKYIDSCVESVLMQTYSAFELILIEDGSKDNSLKHCEALCAKDKRIRLIRENHKGVSAARNLGIEAAEGKYLFFLDSDDMIHPHLLESLYKLQKEKHTVITTEEVYYGKMDFKEKVDWIKTSHYTTRRLYLDSDKAIKYINQQPFCTVFGNLISRKVISSVRFKVGLDQAEDTLFMYQLMAKGADVAVLCCDWYYYRRHENSASKNLSPEACQDRYQVSRYICSHEIISGRLENAVYREWDIILMIAEWDRRGRMNQNVELVKYAKNFAKKEKKRKIFNQLKWWMKLYYYLFLYCYPISEIARNILIIIKNVLRGSKEYLK